MLGGTTVCSSSHGEYLGRRWQKNHHFHHRVNCSKREEEVKTDPNPWTQKSFATSKQAAGEATGGTVTTKYGVLSGTTGGWRKNPRSNTTAGQTGGSAHSKRHSKPHPTNQRSSSSSPYAASIASGHETQADIQQVIATVLQELRESFCDKNTPISVKSLTTCLQKHRLTVDQRTLHSLLLQLLKGPSEERNRLTRGREIDVTLNKRNDRKSSNSSATDTSTTSRRSTANLPNNSSNNSSRSRSNENRNRDYSHTPHRSDPRISAKWQQAIALMDAFQSAGVSANTRIYTTLISCAG